MPAQFPPVDLRSQPVARRTVLAAGGLTALLGAIILVGWHARALVLLQIHPTFAPMQYNTALGFFLCGTAVLGAALKQRSLALGCGAAAGGMGLLTLFQYLAGYELGIDTLLMEPYLTVATSHAGRMAPNTALSFLLAGAATIVLDFATSRRSGALFAGLLGSLVLLLGTAAAIGYLVGLEAGYGWASLTRMALHTALGFVVLGGGLVAASTHGLQGSPAFEAGLPVLAAAAIALVMLFLWAALRERENEHRQRTVAVATASVTNELVARLHVRAQALMRMAKRWETRGRPPEEEWVEDASLYVSHGIGTKAVQWVDPSYRVRWIVPRQGNEAALGVDLGRDETRRAALEAARDRREPVMTREVELVQGGKGIALVVPIFRGEEFQGFIGGVSETEALIRDLLANVAPGHSVAVFDGEREIYRRELDDEPALTAWAQVVDVPIYGATWRLQAWPGRALFAAPAGRLGAVLLVVGLVTAALVGLSLHFARVASQRARAVREGEARLQTILDGSPAVISVKDLEGRYLLINREYQRLFHVTKDGFRGKTDHDFFPSAIADSYRANDRLVIERNAPLQAEEAAIQDDGPHTYLSVKFPLHDVSGKVCATCGISTDITDRKRDEEKLDRFARELARSNEELQQFAYVASHDLQEPLRMVASYTQLLAKRYRGKLGEDADEFIGYAVDGATRMQTLINDLLAYSRVGTRGQPPAPTDADAVLTRVLHDLEAAIGESGAVVTHDRLPTVPMDEVQLGQLLQNLVSNAIKFRDEAAPRVHISAERSNEEWTFAVEDNGIGIAPEHRERIFVIFQRLHSRSRYPGTGIGLAICKKIVERHGGRIWLELEPGKGTTVLFTVPAAAGVERPVLEATESRHGSKAP